MKSTLIAVLAIFVFVSTLDLVSADAISAINSKLSEGYNLDNYEECDDFDRLCYLTSAIRAYMEAKMNPPDAKDILAGVVKHLKQYGQQKDCSEAFHGTFRF